jgi:hypothetical protein
VLKSVIFFSNCQYDDAETVIAQFNERYGDLRPSSSRYLQQYGDNNAFFRVPEGRAQRPRVPARAASPVVRQRLSATARSSATSST